MISSTFYDLRQVRSDLKQFIEDDLGYRPLLSEFSSFPVDPERSTIENCRQRVEQDANIFVLIIGGRYGSTDDADARSITNIEYLTAERKGLPVYAFVKKSVASILPVWRQNKDADFSKAVDDPRLFEFLEDIYDKVWVHQFEDAGEIVEALRRQFAYLAGEAFELRSSVASANNRCIHKLEGVALRLVLEKPFFWEGRLFSRLVSDGLQQTGDLRRSYEKGIVSKPGPRLDDQEAFDWMRDQFPRVIKLVNAYSTLINEAFHDAIGQPGEAGDPQEIRFVAEKLVEVHREMLRWSQEVRATSVSECMKPPMQEMSFFLDDLIGKTESYGEELVTKIDEAEKEYNDTGEAKIEHQLEIDVPNTGIFLKKLEKAHANCL